jgi:hypothetical protein
MGRDSVREKLCGTARGRAAAPSHTALHNKFNIKFRTPRSRVLLRVLVSRAEKVSHEERTVSLDKPIGLFRAALFVPIFQRGLTRGGKVYYSTRGTSISHRIEFAGEVKLRDATHRANRDTE